MALVNCPECGNENVSDKAVSCPKCGYSIKKYFHNEKNVLKKGKQKHKFIKAIRKISLFIVIIIILVIGIQFIQNKIQYSSAIKAYEEGNYKTAYDYFKNRKEDEYFEKIVEAYTRSLLNEDELKKASIYVEMITDEVVKNELQNILNQKLDYKEAVSLYENGYFDKAITMFASLQDYENSNEYLQIAKRMKNLQGQWLLVGGVKSPSLFSNYKSYNFAAITIEGWNAKLYNCLDGKSDYNIIASARLSANDSGGFNFEDEKVQYEIFTINKSLGVKIIKDTYFRILMASEDYSVGGYDGMDLIFDDAYIPAL